VTQPHPITPPPELVEQWAHLPADWNTVAFLIAQWGADQELQACCALMDNWGLEECDLRDARRPNLTSLKQQALVALHAVASGANDMREQRQDLETIRLALEQLDD